MINNKTKIFILSVIILHIIISLACLDKSLADIYMYVDEDGTIHFTNAPTSPDYQLYIREKSSVNKKVRSASQFDTVIKKAAEQHDLSVSIIKAIIKVESNFNPKAVSRKGAKGLMQIMPENFKKLNIKNPFDPHQNIMGGTRYFKNMLKKFGKLRLALAAYNAGPNVVARYKKIPPYTETQNYVQKVMRYYYLYKKG